MLLNYQQKQAALNEVDQKFEIIFVIHGLFGSLSNLAGLATHLQPYHNIISVDLRNHGNSPHCPTMSYEEMANDLFNLANYLNIDNFSIIGHSMGGKVAMACALQQPKRINKVVVIDIAPVNYERKHQDIINGLTAIHNQNIVNRKSADVILQKQIKTIAIRQFLLKSLQKKKGFYQLKFNLEAIINNYDLLQSGLIAEEPYNKETLFIKGANSNYISPEYKNETLHLFPQAKIKIVNNTGHWLHTEKPKIVNRIITQFFG